MGEDDPRADVRAYIKKTKLQAVQNEPSKCPMGLSVLEIRKKYLKRVKIGFFLCSAFLIVTLIASEIFSDEHSLRIVEVFLFPFAVVFVGALIIFFVQNLILEWKTNHRMFFLFSILFPLTILFFYFIWIYPFLQGKILWEGVMIKRTSSWCRT